MKDNWFKLILVVAIFLFLGMISAGITVKHETGNYIDRNGVHLDLSR